MHHALPLQNGLNLIRIAALFFTVSQEAEFENWRQSSLHDVYNVIRFAALYILRSNSGGFVLDSLCFLFFILLFKFQTEKQDDSKTHQNRFTNPSKSIHKPIKTYSRINQNHPALMQQRSNNDSGPNQYPTHVNRTDCFN